MRNTLGPRQNGCPVADDIMRIIFLMSPIVPFHYYFFPQQWATEQCILSYKQNNPRLYSNISQILLLYEVWGRYNKLDSMKSLGVYYWYVKMPPCGCVEHGLEYITFYVEIDSPFGWPPGSLHTLGADGHIKQRDRILCGLKFFAFNILCGEYLQSSLHLMLQIWWKLLLWKMCQKIMMRF